MRRAAILCASVLTTAATYTEASGLSEITGIHVDLNRGRVRIEPPNLAAIPDVIRSLPQDIAEALLNPAAPALASAIRFSRGQAQNRGVDPIPSNVRHALAPYFPPQILNKVRWTTAGGISLDGALTNWGGAEGAVTLDDVIVFSDGNSAQSDLQLWAHELTHVLQYSQLGIEGFAFQYFYDWDDLEGQADTNANSTMASIVRTQSGQPMNWGYEGQPAMPANRLSWGVINQGARRVIDPVACIWIDLQANRTGNKCAVPIVVTGIVVRRFADGATYTKPCNVSTCVFYPSDNEPIISPIDGQVVGVTAAYQP
jgi:hypothetical protein